jgi:hypothetical protein
MASEIVIRSAEEQDVPALVRLLRMTMSRGFSAGLYVVWRLLNTSALKAEIE